MLININTHTPYTMFSFIKLSNIKHLLLKMFFNILFCYEEIIKNKFLLIAPLLIHVGFRFHI